MTSRLLGLLTDIMKTCVIGAGPAGLTAAYQLTKHTSDVAIFEAANCVGGLARSFSLWGRTVDLGPHRFFSRDRRVNELWLEVVGRDYTMINRQTRILHNGKLFQYPLKAFDALAKLGLGEATRCLGSYAREWFSPTMQDGSFESWVRHGFGNRLFEIFFKTYSEKLWGIPCDELDADFAAQRIRKFSLCAAIKSALSARSRTKHRTLADAFAYPLSGTGVVYERMANAIQKRGGRVYLETPVKKVLTEESVSTGFLPDRIAERRLKTGDKRFSGRKAIGIELSSGERLMCDQVISTMPLTTLVRQLDDVPLDVINACQKLQFRNTIFVYLEVLNENPFGDNWIYVHSPEFRFGRVTNFRNWAPWPDISDYKAQGSALREEKHVPLGAILAMEYWCNSDSDFWKWDDEELITLARREIVKSGLVDSQQKLGQSFVIRVPKCYPVYRHGYQRHLQPIREFLGTISNLQVIGRYGSFKYNNQDHSILMGRLAAENVLLQKEHDLWGVNTDYEHYQEACAISETGLANTA